MRYYQGVFTKKICDTGLGGVGGQKGIKTHNCKKSLLSFNYYKQSNFVFGGSLIINYVNCKLFFAKNLLFLIGILLE